MKSLILTLTAVLFLTGCANKKGSSSAGGGVEGDYVNGTPLPDRQDGVSFMSDNVDKARFQPIYFTFDSYDVGSSETGKLQEVAAFLKGGRNTIIIAGFTDERGTPEYNRGLGERRAQSVRNALGRLGADASRLQTVSFGAEMPADPGSDESAWAKNRRAEFGVVK